MVYFVLYILHPARFFINEIIIIEVMFVYLKLLVACTNSKLSILTMCRCDRILCHGKGMRLLSYKTVDIRLSDHRPVIAVYMADVEVFSSKKLQRALTFTDAEVEEQLSFEEDSTSGIYNLGLC